MQPVVPELPPPGPDFEEEEEEHEEEAGADVQDHTQAHVDAVEAQTQDPNSPSSSSIFSSSSSSSHPGVGHLLLLLPPVSCVSGSRLRLLLPVLLLRLAAQWGVGVWRRRSRESWGSEGVLGVEVGRSVVTPEEEEDVVLVPDVDAVFLLVAGGAEGGARPRRFGEEGVVTQGAWRVTSQDDIIGLGS